MKQSGIYQITNTVSNKKYIGSAVNISRRWHRHKSEMRHKKHENRYLQNSWDKHGEENFNFEILAICPKEYLLKMEQWFIDNINPEYNILRTAGSALGLKLTDAAKLKISMANKGRHLSDGAKKRIGDANRGQNSPLWGTELSDERKKHLSDFKKNDKHCRELFKQVQNNNRKKVYQYTLNGEFVKSFNSAKDAAIEYGVTAKAISQVASNRRWCKTCNGFQFKYIYKEKIAPVNEKHKKIVVYKDGVEIGVYPSVTSAAKALNINKPSLASHINGKRYKKVGGYTAKEITKEEYQRKIN